jgi:hypothetical protein
MKDAWLYLCVAFGVTTSIFSIAEMSRNGRSTGEYAYYRGAPRWLRWLLQDEDQYARDFQRRKLFPDVADTKHKQQ